jgi:amino acid adenylation domain-containing protein
MISWNSKRHETVTSPSAGEVHQLVEAKAAEQPSAPAIQSHDASLSYGQLDELANVLAGRILETGLDPSISPFVGLYMDKSAAAVVSMFAILKAGFAFMPLSPSQPPARTASLLNSAGAKLVLATPRHCEALSKLSVDSRVIPLDMTKLSSDRSNFQHISPDKTIRDNSRPAYLLYTSGTTGQPKGVVMEHRSWSSAISCQAAYFTLGSETRMLQFSSYTFDVSLFEIFVTLASGGCVVAPSEHDRMNNLSGYTKSMKINALSMTPTVARLLDPRDMSDIELIVFAGEALAQSDIDAWTHPGRRIVNAYGPTEACIYASARDISTGGVERKATNIGKPLGVDLWVVNPVTDTLCPIGAVGELCIGGAQLARGYHGDAATTLKAFTDCLLRNVPSWKHGRRLYRTGDLVRFESDGSIDFLGRQDGQVKLRGQRISLAEIEHHIQHFMNNDVHFRHATVQLHKQDRGGPVEASLVAFLVMNLKFDYEIRGVGCSHMSRSKDMKVVSMSVELRKRLRSVLPEYMVPSTFLAVAHLPTTTSGKLDRHFIQECLQAVTPVSVEQVKVASSPLTPEQTLLQGWWSRTLGVDAGSISSESDFFALGGNSLSGIKLVSLARSCGRTLSYENVLSSPILSDMAACVTVSATHTTTRPFGLLSKKEAGTVVKNILPFYGVKPEDVEDIYPTTSLQESVMSLTARNRHIYLLILSMEVPATQLKMVKESWAASFGDFELLRTRIVPSSHGTAYQVVTKHRELEWTEVADVPAFAEYVYSSHDYGQPLVRVGVVKSRPLHSSHRYSGSEEDKVTVLFSASHAIYDGWALKLIWPRLFSKAGVVSSVKNRASVTPFREYIRYHMTLDSDAAATFWRSKLEGISSTPFPKPPCSLPADHVTATRKSIKRKFTIPSARAGKHGVTTAVVVQAAWALTVSHFTANDEVLFISELSGRDLAAAKVPGVDTIAGPTLSAVPFRTLIDRSSTVSAFFSQLQQENMEVARHAHIGIERISRLSRDCRKSCARSSTFNFQAVEMESIDDTDSGPYKPKQYVSDGFSSGSLMAESMFLVGGEFVLALNYDPAYLQENEAIRVMETWVIILENIYAADPTTTLRRTTPIPGTPLRQVDDSDALKCIHDVVRRQAETQSFQQASQSWDGSMTYMQLEDLSSSLAEQLSRRGVGSGNAVGLVFEPSKWSVVAMLGVLKVNAYFVWLDPENTTSIVCDQLEEVSAHVLLTSAHHSPDFSSSPFDVVVVDEDALPPPTTAFLKPAYHPETPSDESLIACALIVHQSNGTRELIAYSHEMLMPSFSLLGERIGLDTSSRVLHHSTAGSSTGLLQLFAALATGATVCIPSPKAGVIDVSQEIEEFDCNVAILPQSTITNLKAPSLQTACVILKDALPSDARDWASSIRVLSHYNMPLSGNEELLASLWRRVLGVEEEEMLGRSDNFFELGGNSVLAVRLSAHLRLLGFELRIPEMFKAPTLGQMAGRVRAGQGERR